MKGMDLIVTELNEGEKYSNLSKTELVSLLMEIIDESVIYVEVKRTRLIKQRVQTMIKSSRFAFSHLQAPSARLKEAQCFCFNH